VLNTQVEHLENHTARLTVEVEQPRVEKAMQDAARRIAKQVNIPGFRKGKAPYTVVLQRFGPQAVLEEAIDDLGNDAYRQALEETKIEPYSQGSLENIESEPALKLVFIVPKKPEVTLSSYREIRQEYVAPTVEDKDVDHAIDDMLEQRAVIEKAERPAQMEDLIKGEIHATMTYPKPKEEAKAEEVKAEGEETKPAEASAEEKPAEEPEMITETVVDDHEASILVTENKERDYLPGLGVLLVGLSAGETKEVDLAIPEDFEDETIKGKTLHITVEAQEVQSRTLPVLNDEFAKTATNNEIETLLDLRVDVRKRLQENALKQAEKQYSDKIFDQVVNESEVKYPEAMVEDFITDLVKEMDDYLRENNLTLTRYKQIMGKNDQEIREMNRPKAVSRVRSSLVFSELVAAEHLHVDQDDVMKRIDELSTQFGDQAAAFRTMFQRPDSQNRIAMDIVSQKLTERLSAIGQGTAPSIEEVIAHAHPEAAHQHEGEAHAE
jgi:trigger factor